MSCTNQMMIRKTIDGVNTFAGPFKYGLIYKNKLPSQRYYPIPCGSCEYCKLKRSKIWAARCTLESMNWPHNYFITLTYSLIQNATSANPIICPCPIYTDVSTGNTIYPGILKITRNISDKHRM